MYQNTVRLQVNFLLESAAAYGTLELSDIAAFLHMIAQTASHFVSFTAIIGTRKT